MSWDAILVDDATGDTLYDVNYTGNTNPLLQVAEEATGRTICWPCSLGGLSGAEGAHLLHDLITELDAHPAFYDAMNPPNGWGDRASLVKALTGMRDAAMTERPTHWVMPC